VTALAAEVFPHGHRELAAELVRFLPATQVDRFFAARAARLEAEHAPALAGLALRDRATAVARMATDKGHMAEVVELEDGGIAIRQCHCPIADVAVESGSPCRHELALYERLLGAQIERSAFMPDSDSTCTYVIKSGPLEAAVPGNQARK
jgi:predicted ArsR family transcriptional regulator